MKKMFDPENSIEFLPLFNVNDDDYPPRIYTKLHNRMYPSTLDDERFIRKHFFGRSKEDFDDNIDFLCYVRRGQGFSLKIENVPYKYVERKKTPGLFNTKIYTEEHFVDSIKSTLKIQEYCGNEISLSIIPTGLKCTLIYYISDSYAKERYEEKKNELYKRFIRHESLYKALFDESCLNKQMWRFPQIDKYCIFTTVREEDVLGFYVKIEDEEDIIKAIYSSIESDYVYRTPQNYWVKKIKDYGMKPIIGRWEKVGFCEFFSRYIVSKINVGEIRIKIPFFYDYSGASIVNFNIRICVDENPSIYKYTKKGELNNW